MIFVHKKYNPEELKTKPVQALRQNLSLDFFFLKHVTLA